MLNTEIREYVSQMNQEQLKEVEQVIIESKVKQAIREIATEQQLKCIDTNRNFVVNQMERGMGKSWGIALEMLYNMEDCKVKMNTNNMYSCFLKTTLVEVVKYLNSKIGDYTIDINETRLNRDDFYAKVKIGNKVINIYGFNNRKDNIDYLYCDDCLPFSTDDKYIKVVSYISEKDIRELMTQCCFNDFIGQENPFVIPKKDLYVDPQRDVCMLYYDSKCDKYINKDPKYLHLDLASVVADILKRESERYNIFLDMNGIGMHYVNVFNERNIKYKVIDFKGTKF